MSETILVADDHPLFRSALRTALAGSRPQATIREAGTLDGLIAELERDPEADLLLLDLHMPGSVGLSGLVHLRARYPALPVAVISGDEDPRVIARARAHGASGFIPKSAPVQVLAAGIDAVLAGETCFPEAIAHSPSILGEEESAIARRVAELTPTQFRVLTMIAGGLLNKQIAYEMNVSEATIKAHMTAIMKKLGAINRTQVAVAVSKLALESPGLRE